eukprot:165182-Pelagomonas_calceolata.AAC.3
MPVHARVWLVLYSLCAFVQAVMTTMERWHRGKVAQRKGGTEEGWHRGRMAQRKGVTEGTYTMSQKGWSAPANVLCPVSAGCREPLGTALIVDMVKAGFTMDIYDVA